jgi:dihydropteroate synthase
MGIINVTPDSFSDGGRFLSLKDAVAHGEKLALEHADILDVGGESTRPFSDPVSAEEEIRRVVPVIEELAKRVNIPISVDTTKAVVAKKALDAGASIINDVSAFRVDPDMAGIAAEYKTPVILMHMLKTPKTMQKAPVYNNLIAEISGFLENAVQYAVDQGIERSKIIIDPGIGFGKTFSHNFEIIKHLDQFNALNAPILIGPSRKAFIRNALKHESVKDIGRGKHVVEIGTQAAIAASIFNGAHIIRTHNVANTCATAKIIDAVKNA